jgi:hypothetical protein
MRKLIAALAVSGATLVLAGPAVATQLATASTDTDLARGQDSNEVAVEGLTLDHSDFSKI